jgi:hypothetical protein
MKHEYHEGPKAGENFHALKALSEKDALRAMQSLSDPPNSGTVFAKAIYGKERPAHSNFNSSISPVRPWVDR